MQSLISLTDIGDTDLDCVLEFLIYLVISIVEIHVDYHICIWIL